jgi:hypothetical protein
VGIDEASDSYAANCKSCCQFQILLPVSNHASSITSRTRASAGVSSFSRSRPFCWRKIIWLGVRPSFCNTAFSLEADHSVRLVAFFQYKIILPVSRPFQLEQNSLLVTDPSFYKHQIISLVSDPPASISLFCQYQILLQALDYSGCNGLFSYCIL